MKYLITILLFISCSHKMSNDIINRRDTIYTSQLDLSVTYSDLQKKIIIYKGEVFFRADLADMEKEAKEVLRLHKEMIDRENERVNNK